MLVSSIFSFSHIVFLSVKGKKLPFELPLIHMYCLQFQFEQGKILSSGKVLMLSKTSPGFNVSAVKFF